MRRANQLGNLVRVLKLRAIHLDDRAGVSKQNLRSGFHDARFARSRWSQKKQITDGTAWRIQTGAKHLVQVHERLQRLFLADNLRSQCRLEVNRIRTALAWIERKSVVAHNRLLANPPLLVAVPPAS